MKVKVNSAALEKVISAKVKGADKKLRQKHTGKPVKDVVAAAKKELSAIGISLPSADLERYAVSVSEGRDFKFNLKM